jgi:hypothetical protein
VDSVLCLAPLGESLELPSALVAGLPLYRVEVGPSRPEEHLEVDGEVLRWWPAAGQLGLGAVNEHLCHRRALRPLLVAGHPALEGYFRRRWAARKVWLGTPAPEGVLQHADALGEAPRAWARAAAAGAPKNVLILYDDNYAHVGCIRDHLDSFRRFSRHQIFYAVGVSGAPPGPELDLYDVVVLHYSVRLYLGWHLEPRYARALQRYGGYKVVFLHDEYDEPEHARQWIEKLGLHAIFSVVPPPGTAQVYPPERLPGVRLEHLLTGYVPPDLEEPRPRRPMAERPIVLGYRARPMPVWFGELGRQKVEVGVRMRRLCARRGLPHDIDWTEESRLYGQEWYDFLESCKAMLGTESGANVFDERGELRRTVRQAAQADPSLTPDELYERYVRPHEGPVRTNQIPPKCFEAIALGTALVLLEGDYSGILQPWVHYIPLKKDYSNADEVLDRLGDNAFLEQMAARAYADVVASGRYTYREMVRLFDRHLDREARSSGLRLLTGVFGAEGLEPPDLARQGLHLSAFQPRAPQAPAPPPDRYARLYRIPGARWVHQQVFRPFHRFWEGHRRRLVAARRPEPPRPPDVESRLCWGRQTGGDEA